MRSTSIRTTLVSSAAVGVAVIWGAIEFFALLRSRLGEPFHLRRRLRTH